MIDEEQVRHVATLARLRLSSDELKRFVVQLSDVLDYINQLNEADVSSAEPMSHPLDLSNVFREDEAESSLRREDALTNAPQQRDGFFLVPPVLEWASPEE
jgi:aspartyl-tRNA(Asn)/glutamyl-tRNA(Gln) amidotransferase subunit C